LGSSGLFVAIFEHLSHGSLGNKCDSPGLSDTGGA
jgi:hypothetical protein